MSPYREDAGKEPSDGVTPGQRQEEERRAARRRALVIALGVPLVLAVAVLVVGALLDRVPAPPSKASRDDAEPAASASAASLGVDASPGIAARGEAAAYCEALGSGCTYAEAWASTRAGREPPTWCVSATRRAPCTHVETGTCGAFRYVKVETDPGCGGSTRYFDATGTLLGVMLLAPNHERDPDGGWSDPIRASTYGHVPRCEHVASETLCATPVAAR
jgi:hypothetical protein